MAPRATNATNDPHEMILVGTPHGVSDAELLSVVMGERDGSSRDARHDIAAWTADVWRLTAEDLLELPGVGPATAARVLAGIELGRRVSVRSEDPRPLISTPDDVVALCHPQLRGCDREHFWALALNTKNRLVRIIEVSIGSLNASVVHPRELFKDAVRLSAASVVIVHNHPSGDPTPSGADIQLTRRLVKAGDVLGIEVLDHVVLGDGGAHSSLRESGLM